MDEIEERWAEDELGGWRRLDIQASYENPANAFVAIDAETDNSIVVQSGGAACWRPFLHARLSGNVSEFDKSPAASRKAANDLYPRFQAARDDID